MQRRNKKLLALVVGAMLAGSALVGCGADAAQVDNQTNAQAEKSTSSAQNDTSNTQSKDENQGQSQEEQENVKKIKVGETVNLTKEELFTVTSVSAGDEVKVKDKTPEEGMQYIAVNWTAVNNGKEDASFDSVLSALQVKDKQGKIFKRNNVKVVGENDSNVIPAGQKVQGTYIIQAPKDKSLTDLLLLVTGGDNTVYEYTLQ